ncbi:MAG: class I tRNA ligase family protein, partial [Thermoplasmata archaeon]|nr:class I tRNA ligase family protein [Thermoplasmata archaeon]
VRADADARFLTLSGHPSRASLLARRSDHPARSALRASLAGSAIWVGGGKIDLLGETAGLAQVQQLVDRLARDGLLVSREAPLRSCPACRAPRSPEGIVYSSEDGDAYLVRFLLDGPSPRTSLLVWIDSTWKLLGTSAVLVHPDLPYVRVRYRRRGTEEVVLVLRSAVDRLKTWLEGCEIEVLEEQTGASLAGLRYEHPLATEFPTLANLPVPAGQVATSPEVDDSGTGAVALVPSHGAGDAAVAAQLGIPGWPVVDAEGQLVRDLQHKYAGLPVDVAEAFVLRDLTESGLLFAQLRVHRGVPRCIVCGSALYWQPSRAWCLDTGSAPNAVRERLTRLVPAESLPKADDPVAWPVSEWRAIDAADVPRLMECLQCGRLAPTDGAPERCTCGANWRPVARRLLPSFQEALALWAADRPLPEGDSVRLYVPDRRRGPAMVHHAVALAAAGATPSEVRTVATPTLPYNPDAESPAGDGAADGLRAALLRTAISPRAGDPGLGDRRRQEERRLRKIWQVAREIIDRFLRDSFEPDTRPVGGHVAELPEEDRAFLSLFERMRTEVVRSYETGAIDVAQDRLVRFFEEDLRSGYLVFARARLDLTGFPPGKAAASRVLGHVLPLWAELYAPIAPFTMEAIHRAFRGDRTSLFERTFTPVQELLLDTRLEQSYARWRSVADALRAYRSELGLAADAR